MTGIIIDNKYMKSVNAPKLMSRDLTCMIKTIENQPPNIVNMTIMNHLISAKAILDGMQIKHVAPEKTGVKL